MADKIITRFAPSPTGFLHIGSARTALFNWVFAKAQGGDMLLRIEDTDRARYSDDAVQAIKDGMTWLGLDWSGEAISQYENAGRHRAVAEQLLADGNAYKCYATPEELKTMREAARAAGKPSGYNGLWRDKPEADAPEGAPYVIRVRAPLDGDIVIDDLVQGKVVFKSENLDDFILLRSDGSPTYMHAVVVDDHDMGVTHVVRGDDHLTNAARQVVLYNALGWDVPVMAHIPLIHGADGAKLSKRHGALGVAEYRKLGYLPDALLNYLAKLGWSHGDDEIFSIDQMISWFKLEDINKGASRFDFVKLANLNGHYIREADPADLFAAMVINAQELDEGDEAEGLRGHEATVMRALPELQPRAKTVVELRALASFIHRARPLDFDEKAQSQITPDTIAMLAGLKEPLAALDTWDHDAINECVRAYAESIELKLGKVAQPLRAAMTGRAVSPGIFDVLLLLGQEESLARLGDVLA